MEYLIIIGLQFAGCALHVLQKLIELDNKFEDDSMQDVIITFWKSDKFTLVLSAVILALDLLVHLIIDVYAPSLMSTSISVSLPTFFWESVNFNLPYVIISFGIAFILGYAGQRIVYKWLGKAERVLTSKAD